MKQLFDQVSAKCSKQITRTYSTSFSLGINFLNRKIHEPIYGIYGFVRLADEIVDSFHNYDKHELLKRFSNETELAIAQKISLNPVLNSFQKVVNKYRIEPELIEAFLNSMEMDLRQTSHDTQSFNEYILGSAEVVGLMCLRVFTDGNEALYQQLKPAAMKLGSAFQKVNFLRDMQQDYEILGRSYFPGINFKEFNHSQKKEIENDINNDFNHALDGIKKLPRSSRLGVYIAYVYYRSLFSKIHALPAERIMRQRIRIANKTKISLLINSVIRNQFNTL